MTAQSPVTERQDQTVLQSGLTNRTYIPDTPVGGNVEPDTPSSPVTPSPEGKTKKRDTDPTYKPFYGTGYSRRVDPPQTRSITRNLGLPDASTGAVPKDPLRYYEERRLDHQPAMIVLLKARTREFSAFFKSSV